MQEREKNQFQCVATLVQRDVMRYSPAGVPIMAASVSHYSEQQEAGSCRQVEFEMAVLAAGEVAGKLEQAELGAVSRFTGFIARKKRNGKGLVFHLTDFEQFN